MLDYFDIHLIKVNIHYFDNYLFNQLKIVIKVSIY